MYKDEMIQLHQFLVYVLKYLDTDERVHENCAEYLALKISPHHIHKLKQNINMLFLFYVT